MKAPLGLAFILLLVLIGVAYYQGLVADLGAVSTLGTNWSYALTGRNASGAFQGYPK